MDQTDIALQEAAGLAYEDAAAKWASRRTGIDFRQIEKVEFDLGWEDESGCDTCGGGTEVYVEVDIWHYEDGMRVLKREQLSGWDLPRLLNELVAIATGLDGKDTE